MASLNHQQAGRDAASFDDDRKEGRYDRAHRIDPSDYAGPSETTIRICDEAVAHVARAFASARDRYVAEQSAKLRAAA